MMINRALCSAMTAVLATLDDSGFRARKYRLTRYHIRANGCLCTLGLWLFL